ncbi:MAG: hypothetical protein ABW096_00510 [Candidatus Thiodiazotropha sp.]
MDMNNISLFDLIPGLVVIISISISIGIIHFVTKVLKKTRNYEVRDRSGYYDSLYYVVLLVLVVIIGSLFVTQLSSLNNNVEDIVRILNSDIESRKIPPHSNINIERKLNQIIQILNNMKFQKESQSGIVTGASSSGWSLTLILTCFLITILLVGVWVAKYKREQPATKWGVSALFCAVLTGFFTVNASLVGEWSITFLSIHPIKDENLATANETTIALSIRDSSSYMASCPEQYAIGPFVQGEVNKLESGKSISSIVDYIVSDIAKTTKKTILLIIIGSADRVGLKPSLLQIYGSNAGLAQARAVKVKQLIEKKYDHSNTAVLALSSGPSVTINDVPANNLENDMVSLDRVVRICSIYLL